MPHLEFVIILAVILCIVLISISGARYTAREPFMAALIEKYRAKDDAARSVNLKMRPIGLAQEGSWFIRTSGTSRIGIDNNSLYIVQPPLIARAIPTIEIPLHCLSLIDSKYLLFAFSRFDVFEIDGISNGQILLPVGLFAKPVKSES